MMRLALRFGVLLGVFLVQSILFAQGEVSIRWYGHAFFTITSAEGIRIATDPFDNIGYPMPTVEADVVTVSHDHSDHNNRGLVKGKPKVIRGLEMGGRHWAWVNFKQRDVRIRSFTAYHDKVQGKERGLNTIFLFEVSGLRIAHLSDIGEIPPELTLKALEPVDILLVPVGGVYSIDASEATRIVDRLKPAVAIPMHYRTEATAKWPIADEKPFVEGKPRVKKVGNTVPLRREGLPKATEIWVMDYHGRVAK